MDNVRRQSITKKISFHDKHHKPYRTIDSLEKAPTRKKITIQDQYLKKQSHLLLPHSSHKHQPERKAKSLSKPDHRKFQTSKKRTAMASDPDLATIDGIINRNLHPFKFSISREKDKMLQKQKYKRSEQIRSVLDHKKMSSISKIQRKATQPSTRLQHIYSSISTEKPRPQRHKQPFTDLDLEPLINTVQDSEQDVTLQDVFESGCVAFYQYLTAKEQKLAQTDNVKTVVMKQIREELAVMLELALQKFKIILKEAGEMSIKNIVMLALVKYEQNKFNDTIMYMSKAYDKTDGNLMLVQLPPPDLQANRTITLVGSTNSYEHHPRRYKLNLLAYITLAEAYKSTSNYLCAINVLLKWESYFKKMQNHSKRTPSPLHLKEHYRTLQNQDLEGEPLRPKKKSYMLAKIQPDVTTSKFKKYSSVYNYSSIQFNKSEKRLEEALAREVAQRTEKEKEEQEHSRSRHGHNRQDSLPILDQHQGKDDLLSEYQNQLTAIYLLQARMYVKIKNYEQAIQYYKKCLECNPRKVQAILELASIYYSKYNSKKCLLWLQSCMDSFSHQDRTNQKLNVDINYIKYHKSLVLLQEGQLDQSYEVLSEIDARELLSESNYYRGLIKVKKMNNNTELSIVEKNRQIQSILMHFNQAISSFTSRQYLLKSYFQILLILVFEKKDYYGAQYEVSRFKKLMPYKLENNKSKEEEVNYSRMSKMFEDDEYENQEIHTSLNETYFILLFDIIDGIICILKMKISKGLSIFKELSLKVQSHTQELVKHYGYYFRHIQKLILQFKFYAYYIQRQYEMSLKHINKLIDMLVKEEPWYEKSHPEVRSLYETDLKLVNINRLMLECMVLMKQEKFNYSMGKLAQVESLINQNQPEKNSGNNGLVMNNFNMVKALCYINLYTQLEAQRYQNMNRNNCSDDNKQILLSAEQLLRHCLISDKENSLIYYFISAIHFELDQMESSLKYIREALEYSDDHMIKHYFCKANTKALLGRYDEAIKDYSNAVIVYKEQLKSENDNKKDGKSALLKQLQEEESDDYFQEKQIMFKEVYLNRAISYIKQAYELSKNKNYTQNINTILGCRLKANDDLVKYFQEVLQNNINFRHENLLRDRLLLFLHSDDPSQMIEISKKFEPRMKLLKPEDQIKTYYLIKQLNNCITHLKHYIENIEHKLQEKELPKEKKDGMPPKHKKMSFAHTKKVSQYSQQKQKIGKLKFDLICLQALKKSSTKTQQNLEDSLITLLEMTEQIYKLHEKQLHSLSERQGQNFTLENLFINDCGDIFKWSDILFFIGVIHYQLEEYQTAIKYFEESYNQKKMNGTLCTLQSYMSPLIGREPGQGQDEELYSELEPLFQNRIFCKEELEYNMGVCYLMLKKYKQAYFYLQNFNNFLAVIKQAITIDNLLTQNQFNSASNRSYNKQKAILIAEAQEEESAAKKYKDFRLSSESRQMISKRSVSNSKFGIKEDLDNASSIEQDSSNQHQPQNGHITPFPIRNRLCSIYSPRKIDGKKFYLSFCLPQVELPLLGIFYEQEIAVGRVYRPLQDNQSSFQSESSRVKSDSYDKPNLYKIDRQCFESAITQISLLDLEMKPIAPWIKQNPGGVIFTENVVNESVDLNTSRVEKKKDRKEKDHGKSKNDRYAERE